MWTFAQISDPHIAPLPVARLRDLFSKRALGLLSWKVRRRAIHLEEVLGVLVRDVHAQAPRHIVVTGDITNIALPEEFVRGAAWLHTIGAARDVSVIPGNHDAYVEVPWKTSVGLWAEYMSSEEPPAVPTSWADFPFVRVRGPVAFIGVSTACPMAPFLATGRIGDAQLRRLEAVLKSLRGRGLFRVILMHHPPTPSVTHARKRLVDADAFRVMIEGVGAELIVHGHTHRPTLGSLPWTHGSIPVVGTPSASACRASGEEHYARYHVYRVDVSPPQPRVSVEVRGLDAHSLSFVTESVRELGAPDPENAEAVA